MGVTPENPIDGHRPARLPRILGGLVVALALTVVIVIASDPGPEEPVVSTTFPTASESSTSTDAFATTSSSPSSTATTMAPGLPMGTPIGEYVAGVDGELVVLQGQGSMLLITRSARSEEVTTTPVPGWGNDVTFDASGESIGMTVSTDEGPNHLFLGEPAELIDTQLLVTSYAWHHNKPDEFAAITVDETEGTWRLSMFTFDPTTKQIGNQRSVADFESPTWIGAWTDAGFLLSSPDPSDGADLLELLGPDSRTTWETNGNLRDVSDEGEALVSDLSGESWSLRVIDPDGSSRILDWAPNDFNAVRWSTSGEMIAFTGHTGPTGIDWQLTVYALNGALVNSQEIPWRIWDIQWSPDERFVLMPGTDNQGTQAVIFYDRHTDTLSIVDDFQDWVQWADLQS